MSQRLQRFWLGQDRTRRAEIPPRDGDRDRDLDLDLDLEAWLGNFRKAIEA